MTNENQSIPDQCLVKLAQDGNQKACNVLLERYHQKVRQIIYFYTNDFASANDLAQEVLIKVFQHLDDFKEDSKFSTWLYRITQNTIKNHVRAAHLRNDSETRFAEEQSIACANSPEYELISMELSELVDQAIENLSEELRSCYARHVFEGQTYDNIAQEMGCPIGTVRSRIFRARKLVHEYMSTKSSSRL